MFTCQPQVYEKSRPNPDNHLYTTENIYLPKLLYHSWSFCGLRKCARFHNCQSELLLSHMAVYTLAST